MSRRSTALLLLLSVVFAALLLTGCSGKVRVETGELIVWDNRCLLHRATAYDPATQGRVIRRCTVLGEVPH